MAIEVMDAGVAEEEIPRQCRRRPGGLAIHQPGRHEGLHDQLRAEEARAVAVDAAEERRAERPRGG